MSNLYEIVPKLLVWIIIDEVDLDLHCGVRANTHRRVSPDPLHQLQGGSNMTGTDLYVNKPHCAAAVRP